MPRTQSSIRNPCSKLSATPEYNFEVCYYITYDGRSMPAMTSRSALITVFRLIPDASATAVLSPRPNISALAPATTRRCSSFIRGRTTSKKRASPSGVTSTPSRYCSRSNLAWTLKSLRREMC